MDILNKIGLIVFSNLILIVAVIICLLIFGWLPLNAVNEVAKIALNDPITTNVMLAISILCILLAIKCIFFSSDKNEINGIKDGILLKNEDGQLVISKSTLEDLVSNIVKSFESVQNISSKIVLDDEKRLMVYVTLSVSENVIIKELSNNLQTKIKSAIKQTSDLEVKEVNVSVKQLHSQEVKIVEQ